MASLNSSSNLACGDPRCSATDAKLWHCDDCGIKICDVCWELQAAHGKNVVGRDGKAHEKADPIIVGIYKKILQSTKDEIELQKLHMADTKSCWFGKLG